MPVILPPLPFADTPNQSARLIRRPHLLVLHRWGNTPARTESEARSRLKGNIAWMQNPAKDVSAHVVYGGGLLPPAERAVQLVPWDRKAWTQADLNSVAYSIESADAIWTLAFATTDRVLDEAGFAQLARITAFICLKANIPPSWTREPLSKPGIARHCDLGAAGNPHGHTDPTTNPQLWRRFLRTVQDKYRRGGFQPSWGRGRWYPVPD